MTSNDSKVDKIVSNFQTLTVVANSLNTASDELTKNISVLDEALKKLNVGLSAWVTIRSRHDPNQSPNQDEYDTDQIGYCKVDGKWGIALRRIWGDRLEDTFNEVGPWLFNDASREFRIAAADKIPEVIEALAEEASKTAQKVQQKAKVVGELASAIEQIMNKPKTKASHDSLADLQNIYSGSRITKLSELAGKGKEGNK